jgi:hypothetical protein
MIDTVYFVEIFRRVVGDIYTSFEYNVRRTGFIFLL